MDFALVTTTIHVPTLLEAYIKDAQCYGHTLSVFITGDKKTPIEAQLYCQNLGDRYGIPVYYDDVDNQERYLQRFSELSQFIPWNCIQRRNLSILRAYEMGFETIVTIDDDNFIAQENYFQWHASVGKISNCSDISSRDGWLNICSFLQEENNREFFPRGYSMRARRGRPQLEESKRQARIVVNGGFWLEEPDIDAITRLAIAPCVTHYKRQENFSLGIGTWAPFNSQNTALHRSIIPAYFLCPNIGRFDDIFASYFVKRLADHFGDSITFGLPLVKQTRNAHCLWTDLEDEKLGLQTVDFLCDALKSLSLTSSNYFDGTQEMIVALVRHIAHHEQQIGTQHASYLRQLLAGYQVWLKTLKRL